jgi:hypothetical protein
MAGTFSWGGKTWGAGELAAFTAYLSAHGTSYSTWAGNHPDAAAIFATAPTPAAAPEPAGSPFAGQVARETIDSPTYIEQPIAPPPPTATPANVQPVATNAAQVARQTIDSPSYIEQPFAAPTPSAPAKLQPVATNAAQVARQTIDDPSYIEQPVATPARPQPLATNAAQVARETTDYPSFDQPAAARLVPTQPTAANAAQVPKNTVAHPTTAASSDGDGTPYYTYPFEVPLKPGETLGFTPEHGYYAAVSASTPLTPTKDGTARPNASETAAKRHIELVRPDGSGYAATPAAHSPAETHAMSTSARSGYVNPFTGATTVPRRTDQGVDFRGVGPIRALGDATIVAVNGQGSGWPGGAGEIGYYILYRLKNGPYAGRYVYVAEAVEPTVRVGHEVKAGTVIARFGPGAAPTSSGPGIETGWGSSVPNVTYSRATVGPYRESGQTAAGEAFARLLISLGVRVEDAPGSGPKFPS